jgi:nitrate/nitrite transporter NarK
MDGKRSIGPREAWILAVLLWVTTAGITAFELVPASVLSVVSADLGVSSTAVSWLVSVFILGMVVLSIPAGLLLDRRDNRRVLLLSGLGFLVTTVLSAAASMAEAYSLLLGVRFLAGTLNVVVWTASVNLVGVAFDRSRQGTGIGFLSTSIPGGFALTHVLTPPLLGWLPWELTFVIYGSLTALGALAFFAYTRPYDVTTSVAVPTRRDFLAVLGNRYVWGLGGLAFAAYSLNMFFNNWLPTYLVSEFSLSLSQSGAFAAVFPAIGMVARMVSGSISDRLLGGRRKPIVLGSFVVVAPIVASFPRIGSVVVVSVALVVSGFVTQMGIAVMLPYVRQFVDRDVAGTALSVLNLVGFLGAFSAPVLTGVVIDLSGGYRMAFRYATVLTILGIGLSWVIPDVEA